MGIYLFIWFVLLGCALQRKADPLWVWICILFLSLLAGLRDINVGTDTKTYADMFDWIQSEKIGIEPGWYFLNRTIGWLGWGFNGLLWVVSLLTLALPALIAVKDTSNPRMALFVYYSSYVYLNSFNMMRQCLAMSLVLLGFHFLYRHKSWKFVLSVVIAMTVHLSAFIGFAACLLPRLHLKPILTHLSLGLSLFVGIFIINNTILIPLLGPYGGYLESSGFGYREDTGSAVLLSVLVSGLFLFIYHTSPTMLRQNLYFKLFWFGIVLSNLTLKLVLGTRIIMYFTLAQVILYPLYFSAKRKNRTIAYAVVIGYLLTVFLKILLASGYTERGVCPYKSILF